MILIFCCEFSKNVETANRAAADLLPDKQNMWNWLCAVYKLVWNKFYQEHYWKRSPSIFTGNTQVFDLMVGVCDVESNTIDQ